MRPAAFLGGVFWIFACEPADPQSCRLSAEEADAGRLPLSAQIQVVAASGLINLIETPGGLKPIAGGQFVYETGSCPVTRHTGQIRSVPIRVSEESVDFGLVAVGNTVTRAIEILNEVDLPVTVSVTAREPFFASSPVVVPPGRSASLAFSFSPSRVGDFSAVAKLSAEHEELDVSIIGSGGGPMVRVREPNLGTIAWWTGMRADGRRLELTNAAEIGDARGGLRFSGTYTSTCDAAFSGGTAGSVLLPGESVGVGVSLSPPFLGPGMCTIIVGANPFDVPIVVTWSAIALPACTLSLPPSVMALDGGFAMLSFRNHDRFDDCYLTWPRLDRPDAGTVDVAWSAHSLSAGATLSIPVFTDGENTFRLNVGDKTIGEVSVRLLAQ